MLGLDGSIPDHEPAIWSVDTGQRIPCLEKLSIDHNIDVQYVYKISFSVLQD